MPEINAAQSQRPQSVILATSDTFTHSISSASLADDDVSRENVLWTRQSCLSTRLKNDIIQTSTEMLDTEIFCLGITVVFRGAASFLRCKSNLHVVLKHWKSCIKKITVLISEQLSIIVPEVVGRMKLAAPCNAIKGLARLKFMCWR